MHHGSSAAFFRSVSVLSDSGAIHTLRYILDEATALVGRDTLDRICSTSRRHVLTLNRQAIVLEIDPVVAARLGYTPQQLVGKNLYAMMPPHRRGYRWAKHMTVVTTGKPLVCQDQGEQGHLYDMLLMPVIRNGRVEQVMVFAAERREFVEVLPDGTRRSV